MTVDRPSRNRPGILLVLQIFSFSSWRSDLGAAHAPLHSDSSFPRYFQHSRDVGRRRFEMFLSRTQQRRGPQYSRDKHGDVLSDSHELRDAGAMQLSLHACCRLIQMQFSTHQSACSSILIGLWRSIAITRLVMVHAYHFFGRPSIAEVDLMLDPTLQ
jgi:hypothetical protein